MWQSTLNMAPYQPNIIKKVQQPVRDAPKSVDSMDEPTQERPVDKKQEAIPDISTKAEQTAPELVKDGGLVRPKGKKEAEQPMALPNKSDKQEELPLAVKTSEKQPPKPPKLADAPRGVPKERKEQAKEVEPEFVLCPDKSKVEKSKIDAKIAKEVGKIDENARKEKLELYNKALLEVCKVEYKCADGYEAAIGPNGLTCKRVETPFGNMLKNKCPDGGDAYIDAKGNVSCVRKK